MFRNNTTVSHLSQFSATSVLSSLG